MLISLNNGTQILGHDLPSQLQLNSISVSRKEHFKILLVYEEYNQILFRQEN